MGKWNGNLPPKGLGKLTMLEYPSIPWKFSEIQNAHVFNKIDGRGMRAEWTRKRGFAKFGTRRTLTDKSDLTYGAGIALFMAQAAPGLIRAAHDARHRKMTVFFELSCEGCVAGVMPDKAQRNITIFDIADENDELLSPSTFRKICDKNLIPSPLFLGVHNFTRGYIEDVRNGRIDGVTFEGVVAKSSDNTVHGKAKTALWLQAVQDRYSPEEARKIIES
jgi:hypothetical protein